MKKLIVFVLVAITSQFAKAQGLQRAYNQGCDCFEIKNHYDDGQISAHLFENNKGQRHGLETIYYQNGKKQYERLWKNGKLDGEAKHFYRDGSLHYTEYHDQGIKTGEWRFYDETGDLVQIIAYTGVNNDGIYQYYHAGKLYLEQVVDKNAVSSETVHDEIIYNTLKEEYEQQVKSKSN